MGMRNCNRSKPHQELLKLAVHILSNIAGYHYTIPSLYRSSVASEVLVDLMQNFRDSTSIFLLCTRILTKLCRTKDGQTTVRSVGDISKRIQGIASIMQRKLTMENKHTAMKSAKKTVASRELSAG